MALQNSRLSLNAGRGWIEAKDAAVCWTTGSVGRSPTTTCSDPGRVMACKNARRHSDQGKAMNSFRGQQSHRRAHVDVPGNTTRRHWAQSTARWPSPSRCVVCSSEGCHSAGTVIRTSLHSNVDRTSPGARVKNGRKFAPRL